VTLTQDTRGGGPRSRASDAPPLLFGVG